MKAKFILSAIALCAITFTSCDKVEGAKFASDETKNTFKQMYPNASKIEWELKGEYQVADFQEGNREKEAWFDSSGKWFMTEIDVRFEDLPEAVRQAFNTGEYATWRREDIDMLERLEMETVYIVEVEQSEREMDLYYSPDGVLIKAGADAGDDPSIHFPQTLPATIESYISKTYPNAKIIETDYERNFYEIDIIDGARHRQLIFSGAGEWLSTETKVLRTEVDTQVLAAFEASNYATWRIEEIDFYQTANGDYYIFDLESGQRDINLKITSDGQMQEIPD